MIRGGAAFVVVAAGLAVSAGFAAPSVPAPRESRPPAVRGVAEELVEYGARSAFVYVSAGGHGSAAAAGA